MPEAKHTPGPWGVIEFTSADSVDGENADTAIAAYIDGNGDGATVAKVNRWSYGDDPPTEESAANAHLIAAAPEMYEALLAACEGLKDGNTDGNGFEQVVAALATARGEKRNPDPTPMPDIRDYPPVGSVWRHTKTDNLYRVTDHAVIEATGTPAVLYRADTGGTGVAECYGPQWCRPLAEFLDGRFTREDDADDR